MSSARLVVGCTLLVSSCRGAAATTVLDAGDAGSGSDAMVLDTTAPSLVSVVPAQGTSTWLHEPIRLVFDEALDEGSIAQLGITAVIGGAAVAATVALEDPHTIVVTIDAAATGIGALDVHVAGAISDLAGNTNTTPIDVHLDLPAWSGRPIDRGAATSSPALAVTDGGAVYAAWTVGNTGSHHVVVSKLDRGTWQSIGDTLGTDTSSAGIAIDAAQRPVVAWIDNGMSHIARWDGAWHELPSPGAGSFVAIAAPAGGDPIVATFGSGVAVRRLVNDAWQPVGPDVGIPGVLVSEPALAVSTALVAIGWIDITGGVTRLRAYRYGLDWAAITPIVLGAPPTGFDRMSLAARGQKIAVAWDQWAGSFGVLAATVWGASTTWTRLGHTLDVDVQGDAIAPAIALDISDAPIVAWTELVEGNQRGVVARWTATKWSIAGGVTFLPHADVAPTRATLALHAGRAPVVGFATHGELGVARFNGPSVPDFGIAHRTSIAGCSISATDPPQYLSQIGCFTIATAGRPTPHAGLVPFDIVDELWTDGAKKRRWIGLPDGATMTMSATGAWAAPPGTVMVKEFALETTPGDETTRRAIETRFLVNDALLGWQGFSYKWLVDGTDATLQTDGEERYDWLMADGTSHTHIYPSRSECLSCHESSYGPLLGLRPPQLARWYDYDGVIADQLATLAHLGVGPADPNAVPFISPHDPSETPEHRMRGYMAANCAHCHNPDHIAIKDFRYTTPLADTHLCAAVVPGSPSQSLVYQLVSSRPGMPALGSAYVDPLAVAMLGAWITSMTSCP